MGCWNETCAISNLPIRAGDPTYFIMLTRTPWEHKDGSTGCYYNDHWFLRSLPVLGEYDDYGKIEEWKKDWIHDLIIEQFKLDLVNKDQNQREETINIPAQNLENITFDNILDWLREGNVKVRSGIGGGRKELDVVKCLVRKDVWDMLLQMSWKDWKLTHSFQNMEEDIKKYIALIQEAHHRTINDKNSFGMQFEFETLTSKIWFDNNFIAPFHAHPKPSPTYNGGYSFIKRWIDDKLVSGQFTEEEALQKYLKIGEVIHVESMLTSLRKSWCPTTGTGSQDQEWEQSLRFNLGVAKLAYLEEIKDLSDSMGFSEDDFNKVDKTKKKNKALLEGMKETFDRRKNFENIIQGFVKETEEIVTKIEKDKEE